MSIDKIYERLIGLTYEWKGQSQTFKSKVIDEGARELFKVELADALNEQLNEYEVKIARLEAKVYAYEAIIKNSNFAMAASSEENKEAEE